MKLGSLFSGSGSFELAGAMHGIEPVWNSEIDPFCLKVEALRFPNCKQLGSVTDIKGDEVEPVDIITFGSPCQDLSIAGKQAGIHNGERSNLFFEAIRIIKEMRNATADKFPRFAIWENVPGAFSSNNGDDFRAVLEAFCSVCDDTVHVPRPADGAWQPAGCVLGDGFSIAWKMYDAQYWGVPQRRKRIYLIADFATERAKEILFEQDSMPWDSEACKRAEQNASRYVNGSLGGSDRPGLDGQVICFEPGIARREGEGSRFVTDKSPTLRADMGDNQPAICYAVENHPNDSRCTIDPDGIVQTLSSRMGTGGNNTPFVLIENREEMKPVCVMATSHWNAPFTDGNTSPTLCARAGTGGNQLPLVVLKSERKCMLRRLTPVECLRLQGLPDWWCDGVKGSDSAIYRMAGNGIALPCAYDVIGRIVEEINER